MKVTLPLVAFSLVVLVVVYSTIGRDSQQLSIVYTELRGVDNDRQLVNPRLTGTDGRGQPFTVTAKSATQAPGKTQRMNFDNVVGDVTMQDKSWLALEATRGLLDGEAKILDLFDAINIFSDKGYECHTTSARYDFGAGLLKGDDPINCQGPLGIITAQSFEGLRDPGQMTFTGGVSTTIYPAPRDAEAAKAVDAGAEGTDPTASETDVAAAATEPAAPSPQRIAPHPKPKPSLP
jgi:lipopolysaccharide export system protein LptC